MQLEEEEGKWKRLQSAEMHRRRRPVGGLATGQRLRVAALQVVTSDVTSAGRARELQGTLGTCGRPCRESRFLVFYAEFLYIYFLF